MGGKMKHLLVSRQTVLFCVERRKAWRMLQSKAGQVNLDYVAQKALVAKVDKGEISVEDLRSKIVELYAAELEAAKA
jgi:pyruvate-ferredoxin/flavodoxin oxidoreductase